MAAMGMSDLVREFSRALLSKEGAIFAGAGLSVPSGLPGWMSLLGNEGRRLGISLSRRHDLTAVAQYVVNSHGGNRAPLIRDLKTQLHGPFTPNAYHEAIANTNVPTIWTTNYDTLIEDALRAKGLRVQTKANDDDMSRDVPALDVEVIKMHGCVTSSPHDELVITRGDYEDYTVRRPATVARLQVDLLRKHFLFVGYSYNDPNVQNVVVQARRLARNAPREHFMILKDDPHRAFVRLWADDLRRLGINCVFIDDWPALTEALQTIARASRGPSVYVTGGHAHSPPAAALARDVGTELATRSNRAPIRILDGQSDGTARALISAYTETCITLRLDIENRLSIFPNPYAANPSFSNNVALLPMLREWRAKPLRAANVVVAFDGSIGTKTEVDLARSLGCRVIPVPVTPGGSATALLNDPTIRSTLPIGYATGPIPTVNASEVVTCILDILK